MHETWVISQLLQNVPPCKASYTDSTHNNFKLIIGSWFDESNLGAVINWKGYLPAARSISAV
jgi:hypothetical protein